MKTKHLTKTDGGGIAILISYPHYGEHTLPNGYYKASIIFDQFKSEDILQHATGLTGTKLTKMLDKAMIGIIKSEVAGYYKCNHTWDDLDNYEASDAGTIIMLEFKDAMQLEIYIDIFETIAGNTAASAGGDDDFFDYMPGFVDIFAQLCQVTKQEKRYAKFIENLHKTNPHEIDYEFYRNTI